MFKYHWLLGTEPRKPPTKRHPTPTEEPAQSAESTEAENIEAHPSADHMGAALPGASICENTTSQSEETETIVALLKRIASLEVKASYFEEKVAQGESEKAAILDRQFSIEKMKDDDVAILFYTGVPNYEALVSL